MASRSGKASMSVVTAEALKDQAGLCCWSYAFWSAQPQRAGPGASAGNGSSACGSSSKSNARAHALPSSGRGAAVAAAGWKAKQQEEELRTVMYLSNWGPNN